MARCSGMITNPTRQRLSIMMQSVRRFISDNNLSPHSLRRYKGEGFVNLVFGVWEKFEFNGMIMKREKYFTIGCDNG
jgi:hypothetical protein